ncbi:hypothetical protein AA3990_0390 [Gluconobacter roseus NBRC 3990]|nr:hypothetical protein AA3990_0390 [Gluconobacter roseus NBRC 3990]
MGLFRRAVDGAAKAIGLGKYAPCDCNQCRNRKEVMVAASMASQAASDAAIAASNAAVAAASAACVVVSS